MEDSFEKLKKMTNSLPRIVDFDDFVKFVEDDYVEYNVEGGRCFGVVLLSRQSVAVTKIFISKGAIFPMNKPNVVTSITVFRGVIEVHVNGDKTVLKSGDVLRVPADREFGAVALEDSWAINISVPRREDYDIPKKHE